MHKCAFESMLLDEQYLSQAMRYYNLVMALLIRIVDPQHKHPWETVKMPLPKDISTTFSMLPEWIVEDVVEFFLFLGK